MEIELVSTGQHKSAIIYRYKIDGTEYRLRVTRSGGTSYIRNDRGRYVSFVDVYNSNWIEVRKNSFTPVTIQHVLVIYNLIKQHMEELSNVR